MPQVAEATKANGTEINFLYALLTDDLAPRIAQFCGIPADSADEQLVLLHVSGQMVYLPETPGPAITREGAEQFVADFVAGKLVGKSPS